MMNAFIIEDKIKQTIVYHFEFLAEAQGRSEFCISPELCVLCASA